MLIVHSSIFTDNSVHIVSSVDLHARGIGPQVKNPRALGVFNLCSVFQALFLVSTVEHIVVVVSYTNLLDVTTNCLFSGEVKRGAFDRQYFSSWNAVLIQRRVGLFPGTATMSSFNVVLEVSVYVAVTERSPGKPVFKGMRKSPTMSI
nr:hypothetical protein Iba_chr06bCG9010 [Ipomoea batatas]